MTVEQELQQWAQSGLYPFHMPGHKRNPAFAFCSDPIRIDATETEQTDDLHHPTGMLARSMALASRLAGSERSYLLVGGSTVGLLAGIMAATRRGDTVLVARHCHRAVLHALQLRELCPVWLQPEWDAALGCYGAVPPAEVARALAAHPQATLVLLTSPTYEGRVSDIAAIATLAHQAGAALLVDEAHGAHFGFSPGFPLPAIRQGADVSVQSLHKTLPAPTQTALLHIGADSRVSSATVERALDVFETSSPSYLLMAGADHCLHELEQHAPAWFSAYEARLEAFRRRAGRWLAKPKGDPGKLVIPCANGPALAARLRREFRLETEMAAPRYVLAMTSIADTDEGFDRLAAALETIEPAALPETSLPCPPIPKARLTPAQAEQRACQSISLEQATGHIAAGELFAYPPGIPLIVPGEIFSPAVIEQTMALAGAGVEVRGVSGGQVLVTTEE